MSLATRCPICATLFRVTPEQLRVRSGQVRCGRCDAVFDGLGSLVPETARAAFALKDADRAAVGAPASDADTLAPEAAAERMFGRHDEVGLQGAEPSSISGDPAGGSAREILPAPAAAKTSAFAAPVAPGLRDWLRREWWGVAVSALLLVVLALQFGMRDRDVLAAKYAGLRSLFTALCSVLRCEVELPRATAHLSIEGDELIATDPKNPSRISLMATLRNSAPYPVAYPSLELSLQDDGEEVLARRVLRPADYLQPGSDLSHGLAAHGDVNIRLALDAGAIRPEGYRLYLFYPEASPR